jgi:hypothetical protein
MLRNLITIVALGATIGAAAPLAYAQPPSPQQLVSKIDRGARHIVSNVDRTVRRSGHRRVRARCNDGRIHIGRTRAGACAAHGGVRTRR